MSDICCPDPCGDGIDADAYDDEYTLSAASGVASPDASIEYDSSAYETPGAAYADSTYVEPTHFEPAYVEPAYVEPAYVEPAYVEPAYVEPAYVEPAYVEPVAEQPVVLPIESAAPAATAASAASGGGDYVDMTIGGEITLPTASDPYGGSMTVGGYVPDGVAEEAPRNISGAAMTAAYQPAPVSLDALEGSVGNLPATEGDIDPRIVAANQVALGNAILGRSPDGTNVTDHGVPPWYTDFINP